MHKEFIMITMMIMKTDEGDESGATITQSRDKISTKNNILKTLSVLNEERIKIVYTHVDEGMAGMWPSIFLYRPNKQSLMAASSKTWCTPRFSQTHASLVICEQLSQGHLLHLSNSGAAPSLTGDGHAEVSHSPLSCQ